MQANVIAFYTVQPNYDNRHKITNNTAIKYFRIIVWEAALNPQIMHYRWINI